MAKRASTRFYDLTGGVNKAASDLVLNQTEKHTEWWDSQNVEFYKMGGIAKMRGNDIKVTFPAGSKVLGIYSYIKGSEKNQPGETIPVAMYSDGVEGKLVRWNATDGTYTELCGGFSPTAKPVFENYLNGVVVSDGVQKMAIYQDWEETKSKAKEIFIKAQRGVVPTNLREFNGRLIASSSNKLLYNVVGDPFDWTTAGLAGEIASFHGSGCDIAAIHPYGKNLAIYRENFDVSMLSGTSPDSFVIVPFADRGTSGSHAVVNFNNKQYFYNDGIYALELGSLQQVQLSDEYSLLIHPVFEALDTSRFKEIIAIDYPRKRQVWFYFPTLSDNAGELGECWILDLTGGRKQIAWYKRVMNPITCIGKIGDNLYSGVGNTIRQEDVGTTCAGVKKTAYWYSPWFSFGSADLKSADLLRLVFASDHATKTNVVFRYDTIAAREKVKDLGAIGATTAFRFGASVFGGSYKFPIRKAVIKDVSVPNIFTSIQIGIRTDDDFALHGFEFKDILPED